MITICKKDSRMRHIRCVLLIAVCCLISSGCGSAKIQELTAEVERLKAVTAELEAKNAAMEAELAQARQTVSQIDEIKRGYEDARTKFGASFKQLAPLLGFSESPLPPFENLKDSSWVGKFAPPANLAPDMKALQDELKGMLGEGFKIPTP